MKYLNKSRWYSIYIRDQKSPGLRSLKTLNMQDKMECDWFKPSKHKVMPLAIIQKHPTSKIIVFSTLEKKMREMHNEWDAFKMKKFSNRPKQSELEI